MDTQINAFKIVIVDDEDDVRSFLGMMLEKRNFTVEQAANGPDALSLIVVSRPDLIILDVHMPGMDGFQVHRKLRAMDETKNIPVLFCTALRIPDIIDSIKSPGDDYMQKPFDASVLNEKISNIMQMRRNKQVN